MMDPLSAGLDTTAVTAQNRPVFPQRKIFTQSPDHPDDYVFECDYSAIAQFMECARKGENNLVRGREAAKDKSALDFGTLFHKLEEIRLLHNLSPEVEAKQREVIANHFLHYPVPPTDHRTADRMLDVIKKYNNIYRTDGLPKKVFQMNGPFVERAFKIPLMTIEVNAIIPYHPALLVKDYPYRSDDTRLQLFIRKLHIVYTGKIDAILCEADNLFVDDNKTTSRGGAEYVEAFRLSMQTRGYCYAAQKVTGRIVTGLIMNAVIIRPLTKTGVGTEFNRHTYFYSQDSLREWELNFKAIVEDFVSCLVRGYFPQHSRSFKSPCSMCDYHNNCALPTEQRLGDLASELYRDVTWNPMHEG